MGRTGTGGIVDEEIQRIDLSYLLKNKLLVKGEKRYAKLSWTGEASVSIICEYNEYDIHIKFIHHNYEVYNDATNHTYKIYLNSVPSNLGNGSVLYFICPVSGKKCRILYRCFGSPIFKSRYGYKKRIYYRSQVVCKRDYANTMYWRYNDTVLPKLEERIKKEHYRGKPTKAQKDYENALFKKREYDNMRFFNMMDYGLSTLKKK